MLSFAATAFLTPNPYYTEVSEIGGLIETWGAAYAAGSQGISCTLSNIEAGHNYEVAITTPWGSYSDSGSTGSWATSATIRAVMSAATLVVNDDCSWTLGFTGLTFYVSLNGGAETTVLTIGTESISSTGYDERLNCTTLQPTFVATERDFPTDACAIPAGSSSDSVSVGGGYHYNPGAGYISDAILLESSPPPGSCLCLGAMPGISGADSYSLSLTSGINWTSSYGAPTAFDCPCPIGAPYAVVGTVQIATFEYIRESTTVSVKAKGVPVGSQTMAKSWSCTNAGSTTSGSSSSSSTPSLTTCATTRQTSHTLNFNDCFTYTSFPKECAGYNPCSGCITCGSQECLYIGYVQLSWPTAPACTPIISTALGYDVANPLRHVRTFAATGLDIAMGCAGNLLPQTWSDADTGLGGVWARPRYQDHGTSWPIGMFYGDGTNCYWAQTYNEGATWINTTAMGAGVVGDFEEGANGLRWFFKVQDDSGVYNVYNRVLDSRLNVVRDWAITTVTGIDNAPIACRESPVADGSWRIGLFYTVGGVQTIQFSPDGLHFS